MKRYFTFQTPPDPNVYNPHGQYHFHELPGGGYVCVMEEESAATPSDWVELPHLLDQSPAGFDGIQHQLGKLSTAVANTASPPIAQQQTTTIATPGVTATVLAPVLPPSAAPTVTNTTPHAPLGGVLPTDTTFQVAKKLAIVSPVFRP